MKTISNILTLMIGVAIMRIAIYGGEAYINKLPLPWQDVTLQIMWGYMGWIAILFLLIGGGYMIFKATMKIVARILKKSGRL